MIIFLEGKIVIKYGTNALAKTNQSGIVELNKERINDIARIVNFLYQRQIEPILVSSGAVAAGMELNKLVEKPEDKEELKDLAAEGQVYLMAEYKKAFQGYNRGVYQLLLLRGDLKNKGRSIIRRIESSFKKRKMAIINTNDAVATELIDNDPLAAQIAIMCNANYLLMVSEPGNLGSGGSSSKNKALKMAKKHGIKTSVLTHQQLEELVWQQSMISTNWI